MNDTLTMVLGCFGSTAALIVFSRYALRNPAFVPTELKGFEAKKEAARCVHKNCGKCGKLFAGVPSRAKFFEDPEMGGFYWECECKSTLFSPCPQDAPEQPLFHHGMCASCGGTWNTVKPTNSCPHCEKEAA